MGVPSVDHLEAVAARLVERYLELGERANLSKGSLADLAGVSRSQLDSLTTRPERLTAVALLRIRNLIAPLQAGLEAGDTPLPAAGKKGDGQKRALDWLLEQ